MRFEFKFSFDAADATTAMNIASGLDTVCNGVATNSPIYNGKSSLHQIEPSLIYVYTDGGCDKKHNVGSWAFMVEGVGHEVPYEAWGAFTGTTNNRMELMAVIKALEYLEIGLPIRIVSDSEYVVNGATKWLSGWMKRGWTTSVGSPVKNQDLWETLHKLISLHAVTFRHVKGHSGHAQNERVDELCTMAMVNALSDKLQGVPVDVAA